MFPRLYNADLSDFGILSLVRKLILAPIKISRSLLTRTEDLTTNLFNSTSLLASLGVISCLTVSCTDALQRILWTMGLRDICVYIVSILFSHYVNYEDKYNLRRLVCGETVTISLA